MSFLFNRGEKNYKDVTFVDYRDQFSVNRKNHVLVDVRTTGEFHGGHLPGAINIPLNQLSSRVNEIPKGKPVVVVCASGNRSRSGASTIAKAGYTEVYNLKGGTMTWMMNGMPMES